MADPADSKANSVAADLKDLRAPVFDTKRDQYHYRAGKKAIVNFFDKQKAMHNQFDDPLVSLDNIPGQTLWSP